MPRHERTSLSISTHPEEHSSLLPGRASRRYQADRPSSSIAALMLSDGDDPISTCRAVGRDAAFSGQLQQQLGGRAATFSPKHAQQQRRPASSTSTGATFSPQRQQQPGSSSLRGAAFSPQRRGSRPPTRRRFQVQADDSLNTLFGWERQEADVKRSQFQPATTHEETASYSLGDSFLPLGRQLLPTH